MAKLGKFLRILFGCHGKPERSFFFHGRQFPICARCTGELIGILSGIPIAVFIGYPAFPIVLLMMIPLIFDGFRQQLTSYESTNSRRFITGFLFGLALIFLLIYFHRTTVHLAGCIIKKYKDPAQVEKAMQLLL